MNRYPRLRSLGASSSIQTQRLTSVVLSIGGDRPQQGVEVVVILGGPFLTSGPAPKPRAKPLREDSLLAAAREGHKEPLDSVLVACETVGLVLELDSRLRWDQEEQAKGVLVSRIEKDPTDLPRLIGLVLLHAPIINYDDGAVMPRLA